MKQLKDIPQEKYNDTTYLYNFINSNKTIGDEEAEKNIN